MKKLARSKKVHLLTFLVAASLALFTPNLSLGGFSNGTSTCSTTAGQIVFQFAGLDAFPFDPSGDTRLGIGGFSIGANFLALPAMAALTSVRSCTSNVVATGDGCIGTASAGNTNENRNLWVRAVPACDGTLSVRRLAFNALAGPCNDWIVIHARGDGANSCTGPSTCAAATKVISNTGLASTTTTAGFVYFIEIGVDDCDCIGYGQYSVTFTCD
jgi:hypothetical protein